MHTLLVIVGGIGLMGLFLLFGNLWGGDASASLATALKAFIPVWLLVTIANLWIGVARAGYTVREELPVLLIVFLIPAVVAAIITWRLSRG
jgi:uncharacterized membrane protein YwaF